MFSKSSNRHMYNLQSEVNLRVSSSENYSQDFWNTLILSYFTSVTEESHVVFSFSKKLTRKATHTLFKDSECRQHLVPRGSGPSHRQGLWYPPETRAGARGPAVPFVKASDLSGQLSIL